MSAPKSQGDTFLPRTSQAWPDPDPHRLRTVVDDVSGVNSTEVGAFVQPRSVQDLVAAVKTAHFNKVPVCMRGTQHSMGGQSITPNGLVLDLKLLNKITKVDPEKMTVTCGPGAMWSDLIKTLNPFGLSPRTMQSYSTFSIGGTLSVNAHGVTTDHTVSESVVAFDLVLADGTLKRNVGPGDELFGLVLGGYGMFGVISQVTLKIVKNRALTAEMFTCSVKEFPSCYQGILACPDIEVKLCRIDIINPENIMCYLFRKKQNIAVLATGEDGEGDENAENQEVCAGDPPIIGNLGELEAPQQMGEFKRIMYKWLVPAMQEIRFQFERQSGTALDWSDVSDRNTLMFETAIPLARLTEPYFLAEDTFILQEYFIPASQFAAWMNAITPILAEVTGKEKGENEVRTATFADGDEVEGEDAKEEKAGPEREYRVHLLNITIRHVQEDKICHLAYSQTPGGSYAFVLYFRLQRDEVSLKRLREIHQMFLAEALALNGTFFLPYLPHYSAAQVHQAYPNLDSFVALKKKYDPACTFQSYWFHRFLAPLLIANDAAMSTVIAESLASGTTEAAGSILDQMQLYNTSSNSGGGAIAPFKEFPIASERRPNSFRALLRNSVMAQRFKQEFLVNVFNVADANLVFNLMTKLSWDSKNRDDLDIYAKLMSQLSGSVQGLGKLMNEVKKVRQASHQKAEFLEETKRLLSRIGKLGLVHNYVSIGDHGRMAQQFRNFLGFKGKAWVVHDERPEDANTIALAVERGSSVSVGEEVAIDYNECLFTKVPNECADLVTMNQGLHHLPQGKVLTFLSEVRRVLKPGGLFIIREHNCVPNLVPMCDCAHMVFNAIMGVPIGDERNEVRAFRSVSDWRRILTSPHLELPGSSPGAPVTAGGGGGGGGGGGQMFHETFNYDIQNGDPTVDEMLCFYKGPHLFSPQDRAKLQEHRSEVKLSQAVGDTYKENKEEAAPVLHPVQKDLENLPQHVLEGGKGTLKMLAGSIDVVIDLGVSLFPENQRDVARSFLQRTVDPFRTALTKLFIQADSVTARKLKVEPIPVELFHAFRAIQATIDSNTATPEEVMMVTVVKGIATSILEVPTTDGAAPAALSDDEEDEFVQAEEKKEASPQQIEADMVIELAALSKEWPEVCNEPYWENTGLPSTLQDTRRVILKPGMHTKPAHLQASAEKLANRLDSASWELVKAQLQNMRKEKPPFILTRALGRGRIVEDDAWYNLILFGLESRKVKLTTGGLMAARFVGIGELETLWNTAKENRRMRGQQSFAGPGGASALLEQEAALGKALDGFGGSIKIVKCANPKADKFNEVFTNVGEVVSVMYQGKDQTEALCAYLYNPHTKTICLKGHNLDEIFNYGLTPLSKFFYSDRQLQITYKCSATKTQDTRTLQKSALSISTLLHKSGSLRRVNPHGQDYNLYKLGEWMQVSMCQEFSNSLEVSPWYRYPYAATMKTYVDTCKQLVGTVRNRWGLRAALGRGFPLIAVPGLVMGIMFGQLQLLANPVLNQLGTTYNEDSMYHRVLVHCPPGSDEKELLRRTEGVKYEDPVTTGFGGSVAPKDADSSDSAEAWTDPLNSIGSDVNLNHLSRWPLNFKRIGIDVRQINLPGSQVTKNLFALKVPVFLPFTGALTDLAHWSEQCTILDISGASEIHVRLGVQPTPPATSNKPGNRVPPSTPPTAATAGGGDTAAVDPSDYAVAEATNALKKFLAEGDEVVNQVVMDPYRMPQPEPLPDDLPLSKVKASVLVPVVRLVDFCRRAHKARVDVEQIFDFQADSTTGEVDIFKKTAQDRRKEEVSGRFNI